MPKDVKPWIIALIEERSKWIEHYAEDQDDLDVHQMIQKIAIQLWKVINLMILRQYVDRHEGEL